MKEYIVIGAIAVSLLATTAIVGLDSGDSMRGGNIEEEQAGMSCPASRAHIEASLHTTKADGMYYKVTRKSVRTPIRDVIVQMRGMARARQTAINARDFAKEKLATGAIGAEKRFHQDTILRSEALLAIFDCMEKQQAL